MKPNKTHLRVFGGLVAVLIVLSLTQIPANATPPSNISFTPVSRATLPAFDVKRKIKDIDWEIRLDAEQPIDVATQVVTFQPHGYSGWHSHPGPVFFTVRTGTLTVYEGTDPTCTAIVFPAGTGALEAGSNDHVHMVRNETDSVAEAVVTYMVPVGTPQSPLRVDKPDPGNCNF